jgi:hypothetical protein
MESDDLPGVPEEVEIDGVVNQTDELVMRGEHSAWSW